MLVPLRLLDLHVEEGSFQCRGFHDLVLDMFVGRIHEVEPEWIVHTFEQPPFLCELISLTSQLLNEISRCGEHKLREVENVGKEVEGGLMGRE